MARIQSIRSSGWRGYRGAESLFLPLSNDGVAVNMIMVFFDPDSVVRCTGTL
jgi:hypothetical protein